MILYGLYKSVLFFLCCKVQTFFFTGILKKNLHSSDFFIKQMQVKKLEYILYDKKNIAGVINFIFLTHLGESIIYKIDEEKLKELK